jgi:hypothetical protein
MHRFVVLLGSIGVLALPTWSEVAWSQTAGRSPRVQTVQADTQSQLVGTWKVMTIERFGANGERLPPPAAAAVGSPNPTGFLVYDAAGYVGITIAQRGRRPFAGARPTPEEAKAALLSYTAFCGTFRVNDADRTVTHHIQASLNPKDTGIDENSAFELSGNRLMLKPPKAADGTQVRWTWEREPDWTALTPLQRRLIGFWKQVGTERRRFDGTLVRTEPPRVGYLIFTQGGHMAVHLIDPGRKTYAAAEPTPEEAQQALSTYASYFGPYEVSDRESYEVTRQLGAINAPLAGQLALRRLEFVGENRVMLKPPPALLDGQLVQGYVTWERVTPPVAPTQ